MDDKNVVIHLREWLCNTILDTRDKVKEEYDNGHFDKVYSLSNEITVLHGVLLKINGLQKEKLPPKRFELSSDK